MPRSKVHAVRVIFAAAAIAIAVFIAYQSTRPAGDPAVPVLRSWLSYAGHFGVYAVLAFCATVAVWRRQMGALVGVSLACSLFGLFLEVYQGSIEGRAPSVIDGAANVLGSALGASVAYAVMRKLQHPLTES